MASLEEKKPRYPRIVLAFIALVIAAIAYFRDGYSVESVDVRTYLEMTRGVSLHGLPYLDNGPVGEFPALQVPWGVPSNGHFWGVYGPVYAYFGAPFLLVGGVRLLTAATCLLMIPIALVAFALAKRLMGDERWAAFAALTVTFSTPVLAKSLETTAYPLAVLFALAATAAGAVAIDTPGRKRFAYAVVAGACAALGSGSHLLVLPAGAAVFGAMALSGSAAPGALARTPLASFWPSRASIEITLAATASFVVFVLPIAVLNHVRFGSYNPWTYGPTPWRGASALGVQDQTIGGHLAYAKPCVAVAVVVVVGLLATTLLPQKRLARIAQVGIVLLAAIVLYAVPELRDKTKHLALSACGFIVDMSVTDISSSYQRAGEGVAWLYGGWAVKSTLECTPLLLLALFARGNDMRTNRLLLVTLAPSAAIYTYLTLRGNLPLASGLGFPWVYIRYTMPALPMLVIGALYALKDLELGKREATLGGSIFFVLAGILWAGPERDEKVFRQVLVLAVPLAAAAIGALALFLWRRDVLPARIARSLVTITLAVGFAMGIGHDFRANVLGKDYTNGRSNAVRKVLPQRCALIGGLGDLDVALSIRAERDVQYADLYQVENWNQMRPLVEHWFAEDRPVYVLTSANPFYSPLTDIDAQLVDFGERIYLLKRK